MVCGLISLAKRMVSWMVSLALARQAEDEGAVDLDAELVAVLGELLRDVDQHALLDVVQDLLVAGLVADDEQPAAVVGQHLEGLARHVALGVAGPGDAELADLPGERLDARQVVGQRVVVEEDLLDLRERLHRPFQLVDDVADAARAVVVAADGLRPQAEGAARFAAAPGVERQIGVPQIADEIVLDLEIALVDRRDERQLVHVVQDGALGVVDDAAVALAIRQAGDAAEVAALRHLLDGEIELVAGDEIELLAGRKRARGIDRDLGADHADLEIGIGRLQRADGLHVGGKRRRRGVQHHEIAVLDLRQHVGEAEPVRRRVDQLGALDQRGGLRQPGRIPERLDLAAVLIARAGSAIEALERRRLQKQGLHHGGRDLRSDFRMPSDISS